MDIVIGGELFKQYKAMCARAKNPGYVFEIINGEHAGKKAIAYHKKQEKVFQDRKQSAVTIFDNDFKTVVKENVLINESNLKFIGFSD